MSQEKQNVGRGLNVVLIDDKTKTVKKTKVFDTFEDDTNFLETLRSVPDHWVLLVACFDDCSLKLSIDSRNLLQKFGSSLVKELQHRDTFVMVGQKGLGLGGAVEKLEHKGAHDFAGRVEINGCLNIPMGKLLKTVSLAPKQISEKGAIAVDSVVDMCGLTGCKSNEIPVHIYSGKDHNDEPKICVNGKYVISKNVNDAGRGLNMVTINGTTKEALRVAHFDTYAKDSTTLEIFLESMKQGEIIILVNFDDCSKKLSDYAKSLLNDLGSSQIQNIQFRSQWFMVGMKGINGFTRYEHLEYPAGSNWGTPIDTKFCMEQKIVGQAVKPDPLIIRNKAKREFCDKHDGYGEFCEPNHLDDGIYPAPLTNRSWENHPIFSVPIVIVPGISSIGLRMTLETVMMQPGINPSMVVVMFGEIPDGGIDLVKLFGFKIAKVQGVRTYIDLVSRAISAIWDMDAFVDKNGNHPEKVIIIEEELLLSIDFLFYMGQLLPLLDADETVLAISAWNDNGYVKVSSDSSLVYRAESFPGLGFMLKKSFFVSEMKDRMGQCCYNRTWHGWFGGRLHKLGSIVIPEVSRIYRRPHAGASMSDAELFDELFVRDRETNLLQSPWLKDPGRLEAGQYDSLLHKLVASSYVLMSSYLDGCLSGKQYSISQFPQTSGDTYTVFYMQKSPSDETVLRRLCKCFGLFSLLDHSARSLYKGVLRFTYMNNHVLLVGSESPFYYQPNVTMKAQQL